MANLGKLSQVLGGAATAGGAVAAGTAGVLDQNKEEEWVGRLRDFLHPPSVPMGSIASQEVARRFAPQGGEISQGDAFWMGGGRPLPQRSAEDAYRMGGMARMDQYKPNTFREIDRQDIEDRYGGADLHGIKLPPVSKDEPRAWFDAVVPQSPLDVGLMAAGPAGRLAGKGAAALTGAAGVMGELVDPAEADVMGKLLRGKPGGPWEGGIRAYHSSPHDFDRFDWSKLRTGEGANTYGAGFYSAENPAVSGQGGQYWSAFRNRFSGPEFDAAETLRKNAFDRAQAIDALRTRIAGDEATLASGKAGDARTMVAYINDRKNELRVLESGAPVGPRTYEVNINARPELMLDWDKPVSAQSPHVKDVLTKFGWDPESYTLPGGALAPRIGGPTGEDAYKNLTRQMHNRYGQTDRGIQSNYASQELADAGIPGIRYLDQGSRGQVTPEAIANLRASIAKKEAAHQANPWLVDAEKNAWGARNLSALDEEKRQLEQMLRPTYNYVVTDPSKLDILGKYGVVGTAGGGMAALAAQDQYQR